MKNEKFRILWSVDPFAKPARFQRSAARFIEAIATGAPTEVLPTHILSAGVGESLRKLSAESLGKIRRRGQSYLDGIVRKSRFEPEPLQIVGEKFLSVKGAATELLKYGAKVNADLIVLSTHARKGPKRWVLGSFAETLSNLSSIPLLIAPPNWTPRTGFKERRVLFATDYSKESIEAFDRFLEFAKGRNWRITVLNHVDYQFYPTYAFALAAVGSYKDDLAEVVASRHERAEVFVEKGKRAGVDVEILIDSGQSASVADTIVKVAKKGYFFVALASQSGYFQNSLLGGTSRQLIRKCPVPVWIIHPAAAKLRSKKTKFGEAPPIYSDERDSTFIV